jgi:hypothetical protein
VISRLLRSFPRSIRSRFNARLVDILIDKAEGIMAKRVLLADIRVSNDELNILSYSDLDQAALKLLAELQASNRGTDAAED